MRRFTRHALSCCLAAGCAAKSSDCAKCSNCKRCCPFCFPVAVAALGPYSSSQSREDYALYEQFFAGVTKGVFVEMGALDGIALSNTLAYERSLNWTGVLIEPNPKWCAGLQANRPRATTVCAAISSQPRVEFTRGEYASTFAASTACGRDGCGQRASVRHSRRRSTVSVPARPLGKVLRQSAITKIDLFSLDVEGSELAVLQTMDWTIPVCLWLIEVPVDASPSSRLTRAQLATLMQSHGYSRADWKESLQAEMSHNQLWVDARRTPQPRQDGERSGRVCTVTHFDPIHSDLGRRTKLGG